MNSYNQKTPYSIAGIVQSTQNFSTRPPRPQLEAERDRESWRVLRIMTKFAEGFEPSAQEREILLEL